MIECPHCNDTGYISFENCPDEICEACDGVKSPEYILTNLIKDLQNLPRYDTISKEYGRSAGSIMADKGDWVAWSDIKSLLKEINRG